MVAVEQALVEVGERVGVQVLGHDGSPPCRASWLGLVCGGTSGTGSGFPSRSNGSSRARPRAHRLFTVPLGQSSTWAASSTDQPYMSTSTSALRCSTGRVRNAASTSMPVSRDPTASPRAGDVVLRQRVGGAGRAPAYPVETGVDDDPVQPRGGGCVAAEGRAPTGPEGRQQRVLQGVGSLLAVAEGAHRDGPQAVAVPADELAERVGITLGVRLEELRVGHRTAFSAPVGSRACPG